MMLDHDDTAVRRHVRIFPFAGDVRPHRSHHAAMTDDYDLVVGIFFRNRIEHRRDALEHILMALAVGRAPHPRPLRIEGGIVRDRIVRLPGEIAETHLAELFFVFDRDAQFCGYDEAGLARPREGARNHQCRLELQLDSDGGFQSLAAAEVRDFRLARSGEAPSRIALTLAMTNHYQLTHKLEIFSE